MDGIKKYEAPLPILPEMFGNTQPVHIPQRTWEVGLIKGYFWNRKLGQIERAAQAEASIAQSKRIQTDAYFDMFKRTITYVDEIKNRFFELDNQKQLMIIQREKEEVGRELLKEELNQAKMKTQQMYYESKMAEMDFNRRQKEFEAEYGTPKTEDRNS